MATTFLEKYLLFPPDEIRRDALRAAAALAVAVMVARRKPSFVSAVEANRHFVGIEFRNTRSSPVAVSRKVLIATLAYFRAGDIGDAVIEGAPTPAPSPADVDLFAEYLWQEGIDEPEKVIDEMLAAADDQAVRCIAKTKAGILAVAEWLEAVGQGRGHLAIRTFFAAMPDAKPPRGFRQLSARE